MFTQETVDAILNASLLAIWLTVVGLSVYYWRKHSEPSYRFFSMPTTFTMYWRAGWRRGEIQIVRSDRCFTPELTPGTNIWRFIVPLDIAFDELARFIKDAPVKSCYHDRDIDILNMFRELVCDPKLIYSGELFGEEALEELRNQGVVLKHYPDYAPMLS